jgi:benzoylformate decarboxylase
VTATEAPTAVAADSVRTATIELLRRRGMTTIFGNPGSTELGLLRDFPPDFRYVLGLHEGVAVAMADGYAQATGRPAFVNLHSACGVGNAMGAVVNAFHNRAPLVITAGNQDRRQLELEPYLFARSTSLMAPYVKLSHQPARAQDVPAAIDRAWVLAHSPPRGPAFVSVPSDDWDAPPPSQPPAGTGELLAAGGIDADALDELARRIQSSSSPGLIVGAGADADGAWEDVVALAERLGAPVWAAPQSPRLGFPEDHPLYQGHLAPGHASAAEQLAGLDLALVLGAPIFAFLPYEPGGPALPPLIHVTDDPDEAARAPAALRVVADLRAVAGGLSARLPTRASATQPGPQAAPAPARAPARPPASTPITPAFLMAALAEALPVDAVLVEESPSNRNELRRHVRIRRPASFFATASGGLGFAMPAAVGIKLAEPSRPVVCLVGDGSAMYAPQALWSAVQLRTPVAFVVVNNARYAILESAAQFAGLEGLPSMELPGLDLGALAASFGCRAVRVTDPRDLAPALAEAVAGADPVLIDVVVDPALIPLLRSEPPQT